MPRAPRVPKAKPIFMKTPTVAQPSRIDLLPEDLQHRIYRYKHELEFSPTLDFITAKLSCVLSGDHYYNRIPVKKLLSVALKNRKNVTLDLEVKGSYEFNGKYCNYDYYVFDIYSQNPEKIKSERIQNIKYLPLYTIPRRDELPKVSVMVKYEDRRNLLFLDILNLRNILALKKNDSTRH